MIQDIDYGYIGSGHTGSNPVHFNQSIKGVNMTNNCKDCKYSRWGESFCGKKIINKNDFTDMHKYHAPEFKRVKNVNGECKDFEVKKSIFRSILDLIHSS